MVAKRSLAASSISRLAAPSECRRNAALITSMPPKTSVVRAGERLRASLRGCFTRYLTDLRERGLAPSELRPSEQPGRPGPEGKPGGRRRTWDSELVLLETLHPQAVEIAKGGNNVVGVTTLPPPTLRRGGKGWDSAA